MMEGGVLTIKAWESIEDGAKMLYFLVQDTGHGISKEDVNKIFDPFFTKSAVGKGSGLGLSICHSIIEQHGGRIEVESVLEKGSKFTVILPSNDNDTN
jgi:signal transduction histidine kinase